MKKHNGMRPQDIVILMKIVAKRNNAWYMKDLADELGISQSEISESLNRSMQAGLIAADKRRVITTALLEFLQHGLRYVFPQHPGPVVRGMPTAHSALPLSRSISSDEPFVWPWARGVQRGQSIEPLHPSVPKACERDETLHALLALTDALRVGKAREQSLAMQELRERI